MNQALLIGLLLIVSVFSGAAHQAHAQQMGSGEGGVILMYHRFGEDGPPSTSVTIEQFDAHIAELQSGNYTVMPLAEMVDALRAGRTLPDRAVAITIDDAYASLYEVGWPKLKEAGFPATLFVATEAVDNNLPGFMSWAQIRELHAAGVDIGSQTVTHLHMPEADYEANLAELRTSAQRIADEIGAPPRFLAYPYGEASGAAIQAAKDAGYDTAFGQHSGAVNKHADFFYLPRYPINIAYGGIDRFRRVLNTMPLFVADVTPSDPTLADNPPSFGFTVMDEGGIPYGLACYHSDTGRIDNIETLGSRRVELRFDKPFSIGRTRINCTAPGPSGRWRWFGMQYYVKEASQ